jgi:teichoic acid transport system permease protein
MAVSDIESREIPPLARLGVRPRPLDYLRSLWERRHFAMAIPSAQLQAQHRNTVLGGLWHLLDPMVNVLVWWLMFGVILDVTRGVDNLIGFLAVGVFVFQFTTSSVKSGGRALSSNEGLIRAISFPRAILPMSVVLSELMSLMYAFIAMFGIVLVTGETPSWTWFAIVPIILLQLPFNAGLALAMARIGDRFRDVLQVLPYGLRVWGILSGMIAPIERRLGDHPALLAIMTFNPAFLYMDMARSAILDNELPPASQWLTITAWGVGMLVVGFLFFLQREQEYGRG